MIASTSMPAPEAPARQDPPRLLNSPELIERLATEMRARSGGELPHSFCVEQVKRQLAGKSVETGAANAPQMPLRPEQRSVFHAWAFSE
ncbi:hypothetical protein KX729_16355 [Rhizobium sp. XQZ8]|uniref:hypothetical protein n=1 Tax=Rhizobium populisoli TaxID=2859785 RepID=UPI001CA51200|nr:hypothetical protein [Rhizobium populisoli]MBW6423031.1 hypothetical protein [Rhizobium populisoli]